MLIHYIHVFFLVLTSAGNIVYFLISNTNIIKLKSDALILGITGLKRKTNVFVLLNINNSSLSVYLDSALIFYDKLLSFYKETTYYFT